MHGHFLQLITGLLILLSVTACNGSDISSQPVPDTTGGGGGDTGGGGGGPPPTGVGMPVGIPAIGSWYEATPVPVSSISSGTATAPTLYSMSGLAEVVGNLRVACSYCIVDGAKVRGNVTLTGDHIVFRNSEVYGYMPGGNSVVVLASGSDIVIRGNHIHNNGNMDLAVEHDVHGVSASNGTQRVWVLENEIHHNSGDAIQVGHGHTPGATSDIYFGRNSCYADKENCVDFK